ncbi:hypothetical protein KUV80_07895 [Fictibacillus nanhaiensis]|uniref:hypothetical protein n=1 Tax=Fictibacillus nanhaiensis TaxID=742169 RepID=UPI001C9378CB|nr:hypothetical protein [Fictibacillus nanhaiensis]MBY6036570.1 hypothetical protein [Fictibacillus nanhaiensis]
MRWITGILFSLIGVLLLTEGMNLRAIGAEDVDGSGIGVSFLWIEINKNVPTAEIPAYANGFLGTGAIFLLLAVSSFVILLKEKSSLEPIRRKNLA